MARLRITIATWDYDRVRAVMDGRVPIEGCEVVYVPLGPEECFHRAYFHREFEVSEIGFSPYLIAYSRGISPYRAIPVFLSRMFRHSAIYVRTDRGIDTPEDLRGRRVGVPEYQMSAAMWARGMVHDLHGVGYDEMTWVQGGLEQPGRKDKFPLNLPDGFPLEPAPEGRSLAAMLADGELDAMMSARAPSCYDEGHPHVARLYEDYESAEQDYYRRTGIFPIMHALGIRDDVAERHPWLAASLHKAFEESRRIAMQDLAEVAALKTTLPWVGRELARTRALMGEDYWRYGVEPNRTTLEAMMRYSYEQGLAVRHLGVEEPFVSSTLDSTRV